MAWILRGCDVAESGDGKSSALKGEAAFCRCLCICSCICILYPVSSVAEQSISHTVNTSKQDYGLSRRWQRARAREHHRWARWCETLSLPRAHLQTNLLDMLGKIPTFARYRVLQEASLQCADYRSTAQYEACSKEPTQSETNHAQLPSKPSADFALCNDIANQSRQPNNPSQALIVPRSPITVPHNRQRRKPFRYTTGNASNASLHRAQGTPRDAEPRPSIAFSVPPIS